MDIYTLFKIFFVIGNYLGGVQCDSGSVFKTVVSSFYSGAGPPSTLISIEDIVMKDTRCFVALLNHIQHNIKSPQDATYTNLSVYRHYFTTNVQMLNNSIFTTYKSDINLLYQEVNKEETDAMEINALATSLINVGTKKNMWYLETGYITNRLENKYDADYTEDHELFMTCSQMYDKFKQANSVLNGLIRSGILSNDSTKRFSLYKSMPIMITKHLDAFLKRQKEEGLEKNDDIFLRDIINVIVTFYLEIIVQFLKDAEILLILAYYNIDEQGRKNKWYFDDEHFMIHLTVVINIVEQITMIDSKFRYLLGFDIKTKQEFGKTYEEQYAAQFKSFITNKELIMNGEEIPDPSYYKIEELGEYPNLRLYYPNHQKINIAATDKTTDKLLNLQAWVVSIPIKMESTIIACELLGYTRPSITKILSRQQSVDEASADKVVERLKSGVRFDSTMQRAVSKPNFERQFTSSLGPLGEPTMLGRLPSRPADNTLPETSEISTSQQTESPSPNETSPDITLRREQSRRQRGTADVKPPEEANREGENSATNPST